jgi:hypothetical protein
MLQLDRLTARGPKRLRRPILDAALAAHGSLDGHAPLMLRCRGSYNNLGHYPRPRELIPYLQYITIISLDEV